MHNVLHLLALLSIDAPQSPSRVAEAMAAYGGWIQFHGGCVVDRSGRQMMVHLGDASQLLESLHALMHEGALGGFTVATALVQAVRTSDRAPGTPADFTKRSIETLIELGGAVAPQQVLVSGKLLSLLELAAPAYASLFEPLAARHDLPVTRIQSMRAMSLARLPIYRGALHILAPAAGGAGTSMG